MQHTIFVLIFFSYFLWNPDEEPQEILRVKSMAVLPFENLTGDNNYDIWEKGIPELLITALSGSRDLYVVDSQTMFDVLESMRRLQDNQNVASQIAWRVNVKTHILGNILKAGDKLRIQVKLRDTKSGKVLRSEMVEGDTQDEFFDMAKTLSDRVKGYLEIKMLEEDIDYDLRDTFTTSAAAYRYYMQGVQSFIVSDFQAAIRSFERAVEIDENFTTDISALSTSPVNYYALGYIYSLKGDVELALEQLQKAFDEDYRAVMNYRYDPLLDNVRSDPRTRDRFTELLKKVEATYPALNRK